MLYRRFGRTELQMSVFSCGGMRYQQAWKDLAPHEIPADNQANLEATIRRALQVGINHIETARGYGSSEMQLGWALPQFPRQDIIVQTKISPEADPEAFRRTFDRSFANFGLDCIDLLGIHGINTDEHLDFAVRKGGCLDVVRQLQAEGKVRFVGFSTHGPTEIICKAIATNEFDYVNLHWYYIFQNNWPAIEAAKKHDMGVFIISPSDKGGKLFSPPEKLVRLCAPLSPMVFNDLFCLSHPQVHTLSLGAARPTDFDEHLRVLPLLERADEVLPPILARLEEAAIAALGENWVKTWRVGLPAHHETPGNINIPNILWLRNLALAYDLHEFAKARYNLLGNASHWFPGCKAENLETLDFSACLANSPHARKIPALLADAHRMLAGAEVQRLSQH